MSQPTTISKQNVLSPAEDYAALREAGLTYIESLASALWTDYNEHDPGITMLEVLCYAITELGYRTGFDVRDLLTAADGRIPADQCFYTAKQILTTRPLTPRDYRKLLIDLPGIQNAWMISDKDVVGQEVAFYADCSRDRLQIDDGSQPVPPDHQIRLAGLYRTVVDLESDLEWGDLNTSDLSWTIPDGDIQDTIVTLRFDNLEEVGADGYNGIMEALTGSDYAAAIQQLEVPPRKTDLHHWECLITVSYQVQALQVTALVTLVIRMDSLSRRADVQSADAYLSTLFTKDFVHARFLDYQQKKVLIDTTLTHAKGTLLANRNLTEDFKDLVTVADQQIALCADVDVKPDADIEKITATIYEAVQSYFSPSLRFYSLQELLARGTPVNQIFEGPVLTHGFIDSAELDQAQLRGVIRTSDVIALIMGIDGVLAVRNVVVTRYDQDGEPVLPSEAWCVAIPPATKAVLNTGRSKIIFYKGKIPLKPKIAETTDTLRYLEAVHQKNKLYGTEDDLTVPTGTYHDLGDYASIQNDLPEAYGTGKAGLSGNADAPRRAKAKQLKAYLMFYDQILADFFSQLAGAGRLLSIDKTLVQTYFTQYLAEAAPPFYTEGVKDVTDLYVDAAAMENLMTGSAVSSAAWRDLVEAEQTFYARRNAFLDHLLARFATSFNDYVLMMYQVEFDLQQAEAISNDQILSAKIDFLARFPQVSAGRGSAMDYVPLLSDPLTGLPLRDPVTQLPGLDETALWDADNISGLEKTAALLTGIPLSAESRLTRTLFCHSQADVTGQAGTGGPPYRFTFYDEKGQPLLESVRTDYPSRSAVDTDLGALAKGLSNTQYYYARQQPDSTFQVFVTDDPVQKTHLLATDGKSYATLADANKAKSALATFFSASCNQEGFYLVEHLLLRPRVPEVARPQAFLLSGQVSVTGDDGTVVTSTRYAYYLLDARCNVLVRSLETGYPDAAVAGTAADQLAAGLGVRTTYRMVPQSDGTFQVALSNGSAGSTTAVAVVPGSFPDQAAATAGIAMLTGLFTASPLIRGVYLTGDTLPLPLAPVTGNDFNLMEVCLGKECHFCGEQDPYSFRASVILPYWPARFQNITFRRYFEEIIQTESPAETSLKICWVDNTSLREFEIAYKAWLSALAAYTIHSSDPALFATLKTTNDALIDILQHLHSEYPVATLHDCEQSANSNVVILGNTVLGTYKN